MKLIVLMWMIGIGISYGQSQTPTHSQPISQSRSAVKPSLKSSAVNQQAASIPSETTKENNSCWFTNINWEILGIVFTAIFTGVLAVFSFFQYRSSEKTAQRQLRAYLSITPNTNKEFRRNIEPTISKGNVFYFEIENFGQTPAKKVSVQIGVKIGPDTPVHEDVKKLDKGKSGIEVINPHQRIPHSTQTITISRDEIHDIDSGKITLSVFGGITYEDVFTNPFEILFCFHIVKSVDGYNFCATEGFSRIT